MLKKEIADFWNKVIYEEPYNLYFHSPFCVKKCKYCVYTGKLVTDSDYKIKYDKYINEYIPKVISDYRHILDKVPPKNFYFGGGTPNLIKKKDLISLVNMIPRWNEIENKIIDLNPAYMDEAYVDVLADLGFTVLTYGIQSFDQRTLELNNRALVTPEKLKALINKSKERNTFTSIDLMTFITDYKISDLNILKNDLDIATEMDIDYISVNPNLHFVLSDDRYNSVFENFMDNYVYNTDTIKNKFISFKDVNKNSCLNDRLIYRIVQRKDKGIFDAKLLPYTADDFPLANNNIIGIGDLDNPHSTMSYIHHRLFYTEKNVGWEPRYEIKYIKKNSGFQEARQNLLKLLG